MRFKIRILNTPQAFIVQSYEEGTNVALDLYRPLKSTIAVHAVYNMIIDRLRNTGNYDVLEEGANDSFEKYTIFRFKNPAYVWSKL